MDEPMFGPPLVACQFAERGKIAVHNVYLQSTNLFSEVGTRMSGLNSGNFGPQISQCFFRILFSDFTCSSCARVQLISISEAL